MSHRISRAARAFLLHGRAQEPVSGGYRFGGEYSGGRWATEGFGAAGRVVFFRNAQQRDAWVAKAPATRRQVGKRHPRVKAFRNAERNAHRFHTRPRA